MKEKNLPVSEGKTVIPEICNTDAVLAPSRYAYMVLPDGSCWAIEKERCYHVVNSGQKHAVASRFFRAMQLRALARNLFGGQTFDGTQWSGGKGGHVKRPLPPNSGQIHCPL